MPEAGVALRRAIDIPRARIVAAEGVCDRALTKLEASLAETAERHRRHSELYLIPQRISGRDAPLSSEFNYVWGINHSQ